METYFPVIAQLPNGKKIFVKRPEDLPKEFTIIKTNADKE